MLERARVVGQFPTRPALYDDADARRGARRFRRREARAIIEHAVPRPVTPVYTELSEILQIYLHRALTRQLEPAPALAQRRGGDAGAAATASGSAPEPTRAAR